jgi:hypothetical protein
MSQSLTLKLKGLWTNLNEFSEIPDGALDQATNITISKDSIAECRRGFNAIFSIPNSGGGAAQYASRLNEFGGNLLVQYASVLAKWNGTTLSAFSGSYSKPSSTVTTKFAQQNQNLYFTTSNGVYKLDSLANNPVAAGVPGGLDIQAATTGSSGFLATQSSVAYRILFGYQDANNNLILGAPSQQAVVNNSSASNTANVNVTATVPSGLTTSYFYQLYRSDQIAYTGGSPSTPDDNMQLVFSANLTSSQISALSVTISDITPDSLRGAALYTNATQQGILQSNNIPPFCNDICSFKNCLFFATTSTAQNTTITLLAVGGSLGVAVGDTITIGANTFTAISGTPSAGSNNYQVYSSGTPAQNVNQTAINLVQAINQSSTNSTIYAYYISSSTSLPGQILLQNRAYTGSAFSVTVSAHGSGWSPALPTSGTTVTSTNTSNLNGLMYSKQQQPEAVPALNIYYPGSANKKILRIIALRDSLFILKEDGIFRLTGTSPASFTIDTLDNTVFLVAPDSAVALNNCVYALTSQGVAQITDSGVSIISRPIEDQINTIVGTVGLTALAAYSFGVAYESERQYILYVPQTTTDTAGKIAYIYNYFTKTWVTEARTAYCGWVLSTDNKRYMGNAALNSVSQERKSYTYTDYTDEAITVSIVSSSGTTVNLVDASTVSVGDILYQSMSIAAQVTAINVGLNYVTVNNALTWATGSTSLLKSIPCTIQWVPSSGQNPGMLKQYSEGVLLFRASPFITATMSYLSDIVGSYQSVTLTGFSPLGWGLFSWGNQPWGGAVRPQPLRHYLPRDMQRCTLLTPQFFCQSGWSNFLLEGLSLQYRVLSSRTSR